VMEDDVVFQDSSPMAPGENVKNGLTHLIDSRMTRQTCPGNSIGR
jgi:hypothetical protein